MSFYLQMDGVDDRLAIPSFSFTEVILDFSLARRVAFTRYWTLPFSAEYFQVASPAVNDQWSAGVGSVYLNGLAQTNLTPIVPINQRSVIHIVLSAAKTSASYVFNNNTSGFMAGNLYDVKYYNGATLAAHYDMTLGNVLDQSGNGRHATLTGGTWISEEPPAGTEYTASLFDSVAASDTVSKRLSVAVVDAINASESESERSNKRLNDAITPTDILSRRLQRFISLSDTVDTSESLNTSGGNAVDLRDAVVITDSIRKALTLAKSDAVSMEETESSAIQRQLSDAFTHSDSIIVTGGKAVLISDSITVTDAQTKALSKAVADTLVAADELKRSANVSVRLYNVMLTTETFTKTLPNAPTIIGKIALSGNRELNVYLRGQSTVDVTLRGHAILDVPLRGDIE